MSDQKEVLICKMTQILSNQKINNYLQLDLKTHILPILFQIDNYYFQTVFKQAKIDWKIIISEINKYLENFDIYDELISLFIKIDVQSSYEFLQLAIIEILSFHMLFLPLITNSLSFFINEEKEILLNVLSDKKNRLSEKIAKKFIEARKISLSEKNGNKNGKHDDMMIKNQQNNQLIHLLEIAKNENIQNIESINFFRKENVEKNKEIKLLMKIHEELERKLEEFNKREIWSKEILKKANFQINTLFSENDDLKKTTNLLSENNSKMAVQIKNMEREIIQFEKKNAEFNARESLETQYFQLKMDQEFFLKDIDEKKAEILKLKHDYSESSEIINELKLSLAKKIAELNKTSVQLIEIENENIRYGNMVNEMEKDLRVSRNDNKIQLLNSRVPLGNNAELKSIVFSKDQAITLQAKIDELQLMCNNSREFINQKTIEHKNEISDIINVNKRFVERLKNEYGSREHQLINQIKAKHKETLDLKEYIKTGFNKLDSEVEKLKIIKAKRLFHESNFLLFVRKSKKDRDIDYRTYFGKTTSSVQVDGDLTEFLENDSKHLIYSTVMSFAVNHMESFKDLQQNKIYNKMSLTRNYSPGRLFR